MNQNNKLTVAGVLVAIVLGAVGLFTGDTVNTYPVIEKTLGSAGAVFTERQYFQGGQTTGGGCLATSTGAAGTLTGRQMLNSNCFAFNTTLAATSITLPASTTWRGLDKVGDQAEWILQNASTTGPSAVTTVAGTGIDLVAVTANDDINDVGEFSRLWCMRKINTDIVCVIDELLAAD